MALGIALIVAVFALELPFIFWRARLPALALCSPLLSVGMVLLLVYQLGDTLEGRRWFGFAATLLGAYAVFAIGFGVWAPGGWNSLPEATGGLVVVVIALVAMIVLVVRIRRTKPPDDPNRALIQAWRTHSR